MGGMASILCLAFAKQGGFTVPILIFGCVTGV